MRGLQPAQHAAVQQWRQLAVEAGVLILVPLQSLSTAVACAGSGSLQSAVDVELRRSLMIMSAGQSQRMSNS